MSELIHSLAYLLLLLFAASCTPKPPSDAELTRYFLKHEAELQRLTDLASAQTTEFVIVEGEAHPAGALSRELEKLLSGMMKESGIPRMSKSEATVHLELFQASLVLTSWHKGISYRTSLPRYWEGEVTDTPLDDYPGSGPMYKKIKGNWYLYYHLID